MSTTNATWSLGDFIVTGEATNHPGRAVCFYSAENEDITAGAFDLSMLVVNSDGDVVYPEDFDTQIPALNEETGEEWSEDINDVLGGLSESDMEELREAVLAEHANS